MPAPDPASWHFEAIGTRWQIDTAEPLPSDLAAAVLDRVERFDRTWSRFRVDSVVSDIARGPGQWRMPDEADALLTCYDQLHDATDGAVNPLIGQALADLGYDPGFSLVASEHPRSVPAWESIRWRKPTLITRGPVVLDVGAAGKGLLVELVAALLHSQGRFTVDASGDLVHQGDRPARIGLEHPGDPTRVIGVAELEPGWALCASASNRRAWGDGLHHVLDGRTGRPTDDILATWVVARSCMWADGLATAHFLAEPAILMGRFEHEFCRVHADGRVEWSPDFPGEVFT